MLNSQELIQEVRFVLLLEVIIGLEISDLKAILRIQRDSIKIDLELMAHEVCEGDGCGHVKPIFCNKQVMPNFVKLF